jgi:hypothetical protein
VFISDFVPSLAFVDRKTHKELVKNAMVQETVLRSIVEDHQKTFNPHRYERCMK